MSISNFLINYDNNIEVSFDNGILLYLSKYNNTPYIISKFSTSSQFKSIKDSLDTFALSLVDISESQSIISEINNSITINSIEVLFDNYPTLICDTAIFLYFDETSDSKLVIPCNTKLTSTDFYKLFDKLKKSFKNSFYKEKLIG